MTPLHKAMRSNNPTAMLAPLVAAGAEMNARDDFGNTPLHWGTEQDDPTLIKALIAAGTNPKVRDKWGITPLASAAYYGNPSVVIALLDAGADPNARDVRGATPLHQVAKYNRNPAVIVALLDAGSDPALRDADGATPLHYAALDGNGDLIIMGMNARGDTYRNARVLRIINYASSVLHRTNRHNLNAEVLAALLDAGADLEAHNDRGYTPLHYSASGYGDVAVLTVLLDAGADLEARDDYGNEPLHLAVRHRSEICCAGSAWCRRRPQCSKRSRCYATACSGETESRFHGAHRAVGCWC